jgi:hypothetical protein
MRLVRKIRAFVGPNCIIDADSVATAILEKLWHATITGAPRGNIGKFDNECIAEMCGWMGDADQLIDLLVDCRFVDRHDEHRLLIHDWHDHAPNHVKGNVTRMGGFLTIAQTNVPDDEPRGASPGDQPQGTGAPNLTKPNPTKQSAAACAAAESEDSFLKSVDLESVTIAAAKLAKAIRIDPANGLTRDYVWQSCVIASAIDPGIIPEIVTRLHRNEINRPKPYIDKTLRDECAKRSLDVATLRGLCPPTPPPPPIVKPSVVADERPKRKPVNSIRQIEPITAATIAS